MFYDGSSEDVDLFLFECVNAGKKIQFGMIMKAVWIGTSGL